MPTRKGVEQYMNVLTGKIETPEETLTAIDNMMANGLYDHALLYIEALLILAKQENDQTLIRALNSRKNKIRFPFKFDTYRETGAADPINKKKKPKALETPQGKHESFPVIKKGEDPYRMAQVYDLHHAISKSKNAGGMLLLIKTDLRDFINCFTEGETSSYILWLSSQRNLHFIIYEWKNRGYIKVGDKDSIWEIASKVFANGKKMKAGRPTVFDAEDLRTTRNPKNIPQELEDIVEILNPDKPSPNYDKFAQKGEERIDYLKKKREDKEEGIKPYDPFEHAFDDDYDE